jgi:hypothetical protein
MLAWFASAAWTAWIVMIIVLFAHGSLLFGPVSGNALAARGTNWRQPTSAAPDASAPREDVSQDKTPDVIPWGPFRTTDW